MNGGYHHPPPGDMSQHPQHMPMGNPTSSGYSTSLPPMQYQQHQNPPPPQPQLQHGSHPPPHQHQHQQPQHHHQHQQHQQQQQQHQHHQPPRLPPHHRPPPHQPQHSQQQPSSQSQMQSSTHLQRHHLHQQPNAGQHPHPNQLHHPNPHQHPSTMSENASTPTTAPPTTTTATNGTSMHVFSKVDTHTNRKYELRVVQQPRRARMCGFGDKDRRPITPPPCVQLIITDATTGKEIDLNPKKSDIDYSMFVLNVDLWNEEGSQEVNLVRSSTGTPSISSTVPYSYAALNDRNDPNHVQYHPPIPPNAEYPQSSGGQYGQDYPAQSPSYAQVPSSYSQNGSYVPPQQFYPQHGYRGEPTPPNMPQFRNGSQSGYSQETNTLTRMAVVGGQPQGMFTRNLIGSLAASAFRLSDTQDRIGIWFVLQDLSVRTEGPFRLRFSFVNVGPPKPTPEGPKVNQGKIPILASTFSEVFNVYSAKKFPGVCESTPLSKSFAAQGIKIPIRKDSNVKGEDGNDDDFLER
ncbi:velvet factor-domain-containing protein [Mariannaea sp. PMI_226]|nr:velvet factor-domain-containing protein [Mariannaea sp. PMI_226]